MRSSVSISTKLSISSCNAMWQQRTSTRASSMLRENIAMSSFVGTNPETCISRQFSLSFSVSLAKFDKSLLENQLRLRLEAINQSNNRTDQTHVACLCESPRTGLASSHNGAHMTDHWTVDPDLHTPYPTWQRLSTRFYSSLVSSRLLSRLVSCFKCTNAPCRVRTNKG